MGKHAFNEYRSGIDYIMRFVFSIMLNSGESLKEVHDDSL